MRNNFDELEVKCSYVLPTVIQTQWSDIQNENPFNNPAWLSALQTHTTLDIRPLYFFLQDAKHIYGFASCYLVEKENRFRTPDQNLFGKLYKLTKSLGISFHPLLVCGHLKGSGSSIIVNKTLTSDDQDMVRNRLISTIEKEAKKRKIAVLFSKIFGYDKDLRTILESRNYFATLNLPIAILDISWPDFQGYIKYIRSTIGKNAKDSVVNNINRAVRGEVTFQKVKRLRGYYRKVNSLFKQNFEKYNNKTYHINDDFLLSLEDGFNEDLIITIAKKKDQISGAGLMIRAKNSAFFPLIGVDRSFGSDDATYHNLTFYYAIELALQEGIKRIFYGNALYALKIRQGCSLVHSYDYYKTFNPWKKVFTKLWIKFHFWKMHRKFQKYSNSFIS